MKALLVVNGFLQQQKFQEIYEWLCGAGKKQGVFFQICTNEQLLVSIQKGILERKRELEEYAFVLFWDKDILLAKALESMGMPVFNNSFSIEACDNKALTHFYLSQHKIPMPDTIITPMTYENIGYGSMKFLDHVVDKLGLPLVVKESFGSFGQQVYLCRNREELEKRVKELQGRSFLFQRFVETSAGRDVRLQVVGKRVVAAMERRAKDGDFRANITNGGTMKQYVPTKEQEELVVKCCEILQADFAGVDLLFGENGESYVCEVNSNAHFKNIYDCTNVNTADSIVSCILEKIK